MIKKYSRFFLCLFITVIVYFCAAFLPSQSGEITIKDEKSKEVMAAALKALGGSDKINDIKSLVLKGSETGIGGGLFETLILLPDNFLHFRGPEVPVPRRRLRDSWSISQGLPLTGVFFTVDNKPSYKPITEEQKIAVKAQADESSDIWSYPHLSKIELENLSSPNNNAVLRRFQKEGTSF